MHCSFKDEEKKNSEIYKLDDDSLRCIFCHLSFVDRIRIQRVCKKWQIISSQMLITKIDLTLFNIFQYLPIAERIKIERVCKRWKDVSAATFCKVKKLNRSTLWGLQKRPWYEIYQFCRIDPVNLEKILLRCGQYINEIDLPISRLGVQILADNCMNLINLELYMYKNWRSNDECDIELSQLFAKNKKIKLLRLESSEITGSCFINIPKTLEKFVIKNCDNVCPKYLDCFSNMPNLQKLFILYSIYNLSSLDYQVIETISQCKNLKFLNLCFSEPFSTALIDIRCIANLKQLEFLNIENSYAVVDEFLQVVGRNCKHLKYLGVPSCKFISDSGIKIVKDLPNLEYLNIDYLHRITNDIFCYIPKIRKLLCRRCVKLTVGGISNFIKNSKNLKLLDVSFNENITNHIIQAAKKATKYRTNDVILKLIVYNCNTVVENEEIILPSLHILGWECSDPIYTFDPDTENW